MKLIIDIPEYEYQQIKEYYEKNDTVESTYSYIYHGTPLEQGTCGDCISRAEAVRIASGYCHWANVADELKKLPSVQPKPKTEWIPVSEKLPEDGTYLTCTDTGYIATIQYSRYMGWLLDSNIVAWMPLPAPYRKGGD